MKNGIAFFTVYGASPDHEYSSINWVNFVRLRHWQSDGLVIRVLNTNCYLSKRSDFTKEDNEALLVKIV